MGYYLKFYSGAWFYMSVLRRAKGTMIALDTQGTETRDGDRWHIDSYLGSLKTKQAGMFIHEGHAIYNV